MQQRGKLKVLFLCTGNSCRSQMAEGWARKFKSDLIEPYSAGIEPHGLDPIAVKVMAEVGVDISNNRSKHLDYFKGVNFDFVITLYDHPYPSSANAPRKAPKSRPPLELRTPGTFSQTHHLGLNLSRIPT